MPKIQPQMHPASADPRTPCSPHPLQPPAWIAKHCAMQAWFTPPPLGDGVKMPQRILAIITICLAVTMAVMDSAIANVALPTIAVELGVSNAGSIWVVNSYQLAVTICLLPMASLGEIHGYQKVYRWGLLVFTLASGLCALSTSLPTLIGARMLQGAGSAGILSINTAMIRTVYPRAELGRGVGINAMVVALAAAAGPTVAAAILSMAHWPWLFAVNLPIGVIALAISLIALPVVPPARRAFDWISALLNAATFGLLLIGVDDLARPGAGLGQAIELIGAAGFGTALVLRQLSRSAPLLPIDLLRIPIFALSALTSVAAFTGWALGYVALPFYFQRTLGRGEVASGLLMTPWPLGIMLVAPIAGRLADRYPVGILSSAGLAIFAAGLLGLALMPASPSDLDIAWRMALAGIGFGFFQSPNNRAMITAAPRARAGGAAGLLSMARLLGQTAGAALVALAFTLYPDTGTSRCLDLSVAITLAALLVSATRLRGA